MHAVIPIKKDTFHYKVLEKLKTGTFSTVQLAAYMDADVNTMSKALMRYVRYNKTVIICGKGPRNSYLYGLSPLQEKVSEIKPCMEAMV